jgi:thiol-disulfide isomerase/thioredoxin
MPAYLHTANLTLSVALTLVLASSATAQTASPSARAPANSAPPTVASTQISVGQTLQLRSNTLSGANFDIASFKGKPSLVMFWTTDCKICKDKMPDLRQLSQSGKANVVTIASDRSRTQVNQYFELLQKLQPNAADKITKLWAGDASYKDNLGGAVQRFPLTLLLDSQGKIVERLDGRFEDAVLKRAESTR